jgi:hypothetical protein
MIRRFGFAVSALLLACSPIVLAQYDSATIGRAEALLKNLQAAKFADVVKEFDPKMAAAIPEERLRAVWEMLTAQFGAVKSVEERRSGEIKGLRAVELTRLRKGAGRTESRIRYRRKNRRARLQPCEHGHAARCKVSELVSWRVSE